MGTFEISPAQGIAVDQNLRLMPRLYRREPFHASIDIERIATRVQAAFSSKPDLP